VWGQDAHLHTPILPHPHTPILPSPILYRKRRPSCKHSGALNAGLKMSRAPAGLSRMETVVARGGRDREQRGAVGCA